jgi:hypothetical protein
MPAQCRVSNRPTATTRAMQRPATHGRPTSRLGLDLAARSSRGSGPWCCNGARAPVTFTARWHAHQRLGGSWPVARCTRGAPVGPRGGTGQGGGVGACDRTTSKMRGLSHKIISGDFRRSENAQTHANKHTIQI